MKYPEANLSGRLFPDSVTSIPMQEVVESALKGNVHTAMQELDHKSSVFWKSNPEKSKIQGIIILVWILLNGSG